MASKKSRKVSARSRASQPKRVRGAATGHRWSQRVTQTSDAMDLAPRVFTLRSASAIARSLKRSAEASNRRKSTPFASAMSMLTFEINRAGTGMTDARRQRLNTAKSELRKLFGRKPAKPAVKRRSRKRAAPGDR